MESEERMTYVYARAKSFHAVRKGRTDALPSAQSSQVTYKSDKPLLSPEQACREGFSKPTRFGYPHIAAPGHQGCLCKIALVCHLVAMFWEWGESVRQSDLYSGPYILSVIGTFRSHSLAKERSLSRVESTCIVPTARVR